MTCAALTRGSVAPARAVLLLGALTFGCGAGGAGTSSANAGAAGESAHAGARASGEGGGSAAQAPPATGGASGGATQTPPAAGGTAGSSVGSSAGTGGNAGTGGSGGVGENGGAAGGSSGSGGGPVIGNLKNPVLPGLNADPQIANFNGKFYIYPTADGFANWMSTSFHAFSSTDLVSWKDEGEILALGGTSVPWANSQAWAPGIAFKDGTYYFYFAAGMQIGVATATSPTGPFKDALGKPLISTSKYGVASIDPYVLMDDEGSSYLYFGSGSSGRVVKLNADMVSFSGTPTTLTPSGFREGSVAFKRSGKYYLGILATGHNSVLELADGNWYIAYHRFKVPACSATVTANCGDGTHREVCLDKMTFNADGTIRAISPTL